MTAYTFDVKLLATITVQADTEKVARYWLGERLTGADANLGAWIEGPAIGDPILATVTMDGDADLTEVDGVACGDT